MPARVTLEAPIVEVTVFTDGARVVRRGQISLEAGVCPVAVEGLPQSVDSASVRVVVRGEGLALRDVEVAHVFKGEPEHEDTQRLREEVDRCRDAVRGLKDEDAAEEARLAFLGHLSEAAATAFARAVGFGRAERGELSRMGEELATGTGETLARKRAIAARRRRAERELEAAERALEAAKAPQGGAAAFVEVTATIEVRDAGAAELELVYHVSGASWHPLYDIRLEGERLALDYLAEVRQHTGEDWPAVPLTLSTMRRGRHTELPELSPWYVGRLQPMRAVHAARRAPAGAVDMEMDAGGSPAPRAAAPQAAFGAVAAPMTAVAEESGSAIVFRVPAPLAVPSDGRARKTTVAQLDFAAELDHLCVPVMAPEAYLRATVTNTSAVILLPGAANVFQEGEFVGRTNLETVAPGEELEVQLGVDDRIRVERELRRRSAGKAVLSGTRSVDVAYEIAVENHRGRTSKITVHDHIPLSRDGDVKVKLRECSPKALSQDELGQLTWELNLKAGDQANIRFAFTVEHPANAVLSGL